MFEDVAALGRPFSSGAAHYIELRGREDRLPFLVCEMDRLLERDGIELHAHRGRIDSAGPDARARATERRVTRMANAWSKGFIMCCRLL